MSEASPSRSGYRGRLAPSPTGYLHRGHAHTFLLAAQRAHGGTGPSIGTPSLSARRGKLFLRIDDLDRARCRPEFTKATIEDLRWLGLRWEEPIIIQSQRLALYRQALEQLHAAGLIYPCTRTRREIRERAAQARAEAQTQADRTPRQGTEAQPQRFGEPPSPSAPIWKSADVQDHEPLFPIEFRPAEIAAPTDLRRGAAGATMCLKTPTELRELSPDHDVEPRPTATFPLPAQHEPIRCNWRFLTPDGESLGFVDSAQGEQRATVGRDLGDFLVWRKDDLPSYQLACVVDDIALGITEVVRGADLLPSTFYQLLLYRALGAPPPAFHHCELIRDANGRRLAKRHASARIRKG